MSALLAPMIGIRRKKHGEAEKDITKQNQPVLIGFRAAYVFDVSQTEGEPLPDLSERVKGEVGEYPPASILRVLAILAARFVGGSNIVIQ